MDEAPFTRQGEPLRLTNHAQLELMCGVIERGATFRFSARGYSMLPFIHDGDVLTISPLDPPLQVGAVVAFIRPGWEVLAVHRVVAQKGSEYLIKGDNCIQPDGVIPAAQLIGQVVRVERRGRRVGGGLGASGAWIARLSQRGFFIRLRSFLDLPRRAAAAVLWRLQKLGLYRRWARHRGLQVVIDEARDDELDLLAQRLNPGIWLPPMRRVPEVNTYVARLGGEVAGMVELVRRPPEFGPHAGHWLYSLHVWPRYRGFGLGELLSCRVIRQAAAEGAAELRLLVKSNNTPAIQLYRKLGFEVVDGSELAEVLEKDRLLLMRLHLQPGDAIFTGNQQG